MLALSGEKYFSAALLLTVSPFLFAQSDAARALPTDPVALVDMTAPYYDYVSSDMKPWHIRYHYQNYDENGLPGTEGQFDYWWSTNKVSRAAWTRANQSHVEWHTADGRELRSITGNDIAGMEHRLYFALLTTFWRMKDSPNNDRQPKFFTSPYLSKQLACVGLVKSSAAGTKPDSLDSVWPAYCFDDHEPVLIASHENGTITNFYSEVQKFQNHNFAGQIEIFYAGKKRVEAKVDELSEVHADDAAFTPSPDATEYKPELRTVVAPTIKPRPLVLLNRVDPVYPPSARAAHITGTVIVEATIGKNGRIKDAKVVSSPDDSLSAAALDAVRQWRYEPYTVNGEPMEIHTRINVGFTL